MNTGFAAPDAEAGDNGPFGNVRESNHLGRCFDTDLLRLFVSHYPLEPPGQCRQSIRENGNASANQRGLISNTLAGRSGSAQDNRTGHVSGVGNATGQNLLEDGLNEFFCQVVVHKNMVCVFIGNRL